MAFMFQRGLAVPLWAVAACAIAVSTLPRVMPSLIALLAIVGVGTLSALVRWRRSSRRSVDILPAVPPVLPPPAGMLISGGTSAGTLQEVMDAGPQKAEDTADLVRLDDDGGWQRA